MSKRDKILSTLGLNVRKRREARELTQEKLAEKAGLDATYISGIERGLQHRRCAFFVETVQKKIPKLREERHHPSMANTYSVP
jgi:transcriptional regulator with XRE-family HTH domain